MISDTACRHRNATCFGSLVGAWIAAAGCGVSTHPVTLSFTLADGSPLTEGFAAVQHTSDAKILGGGPIGADGSCRPLLRGRSAPGLPAGTYRVGVTGPSASDFDAPPQSPPFAPRYMNPTESGLSFTVGSGSPENTAFSLEKSR